MAHAHRARREDGGVGAALALQLQLGAFEARPDLVVADAERALRRDVLGIRQRRDLALAPFLELLRSGGVVAVAIDDHLFVFSRQPSLRVTSSNSSSTAKRRGIIPC